MYDILYFMINVQSESDSRLEELRVFDDWASFPFHQFNVSPRYTLDLCQVHFHKRYGTTVREKTVVGKNKSLRNVKLFVIIKHMFQQLNVFFFFKKPLIDKVYQHRLLERHNC